MLNSITKRLLLTASLTLAAAIGFAPSAKAEMVPYTCWNSYPFRGTVVTIAETCYREVYVAPVQPVFNANSRLDADANIRTGASINSRVIAKTKRVQTIQIHSYSADGDWAYITTSFGTVGWTSEVNIIED